MVAVFLEKITHGGSFTVVELGLPRLQGICFTEEEGGEEHGADLHLLHGEGGR